MQLFHESDVGIVQMPCPELLCLGLDRGTRDGTRAPLLEENTRIRTMMSQRPAQETIRHLVQHLIVQLREYRKYGFQIRGIVGVNRSPSCGVETTTNNNQEVEGPGVFIDALRHELTKHNLNVRMVGIKAFEPNKAVETMKHLMR
jgi:predicted secreted protein